MLKMLDVPAAIHTPQLMEAIYMIFSELYSVYYNTVAKIIAVAFEPKTTEEDLQCCVLEEAFSESVLTILPALKSRKWPLLSPQIKLPESAPCSDNANFIVLYRIFKTLRVKTNPHLFSISIFHFNSDRTFIHLENGRCCMTIYLRRCTMNPQCR